MVSGSVVFYKIATTCLLILVGFIARRMQLLPPGAVAVLSKYIVFLALPAYFIFYMPSTVSPETLGADWLFPLVGVLVMAASDLFAYMAARLWARPGEVGTFRLMVGVPNWIFMALAVCEPLFPEDGVRVILLYNVGVLFYLWTAGMTSFRHGVGLWRVLREVFLNAQTVSLAIGFALAMLFPALRGMEKLTAAELAALPFHIGVVTPLWEVLSLLAATALPISIVQIGVLLGGPREGAAPASPTSVSTASATPASPACPAPVVPALPVSPALSSDARQLLLTSLLRLLAGPALITLFLVLLCRLGLHLTANEFTITVIMMAMPAAVLSVSITEVYGGATRLAAKGILWMTAASLFTAPAATYFAQIAYGWI